MDFTVTRYRNTVRFDEVDYGELFEYKGTIFMKIQYRDLNDDFIEGAVELWSGEASFDWGPENDVTPMVAKDVAIEKEDVVIEKVRIK